MGHKPRDSVGNAPMGDYKGSNAKVSPSIKHHTIMKHESTMADAMLKNLFASRISECNPEHESEPARRLGPGVLTCY